MPEHAFAVLREGLFQGRTVVVTGGGRGIGKVIALRFAALGANVVVAGRHIETLSATVAEAEALGSGALAVATDIREVAQVEALVGAAQERFGRIDFLINNAGGQFPARPSAISDRGWRAVIDLNLNGTWNVCSRVGPVMTAQGFGAIVNIVHVYSFDRGAPAFIHSGAARAGVVNMTKTLANYWGRQGVTVNALAPGSVDTAGLREKELAQLEDPENERRQVAALPVHRLGDAAEVAEICAFLCSPAARYINGAANRSRTGRTRSTWRCRRGRGPDYGRMIPNWAARSSRAA